MTTDSILQEAERLVNGDRNAQYGPPDQDFQRVAQMWTALKGVPFEAREVAMFMICLKLSREVHQKKRDSWVDIAGYAHCGYLCGPSEPDPVETTKVVPPKSEWKVVIRIDCDEIPGGGFYITYHADDGYWFRKDFTNWGSPITAGFFKQNIGYPYQAIWNPPWTKL